MKIITTICFLLLCELGFCQVELKSSYDSLRISIFETDEGYKYKREIFELLITKNNGYLKKVRVPRRNGITWAYLDSLDCLQILENFNKFSINTIFDSQPKDTGYPYINSKKGTFQIYFADKDGVKYLKNINYFEPEISQVEFRALYSWIILLFKEQSFVYTKNLDTIPQKKYVFQQLDFTTLANSFEKPNSLIYINKENNLILEILSESVAAISDSTQIDLMIAYLYSVFNSDYKKEEYWNSSFYSHHIAGSIIKCFSQTFKSYKILVALCNAYDSVIYYNNLPINIFQALIFQDDCEMKFKYLEKGLTSDNRDIVMSCAFELAENGYSVAKEYILKEMHMSGGYYICYLLKIQDEELLINIFDIYKEFTLRTKDNPDPSYEISKKMFLFGMLEMIHPDKRLSNKDCQTFLQLNDEYWSIKTSKDFNHIEKIIERHIKVKKNAP